MPDDTMFEDFPAPPPQEPSPPPAVPVSRPSAPPSPPEPEPKDGKAKMLALIDKHFPVIRKGGVEAHQPLRDFFLEVAEL